MQESLRTDSDRVSRLGWETASERPLAWRSPWRHLDPILVLAALGLALLGMVAIYSASFELMRSQGLPGSYLVRRQALNAVVGLGGMVVVTLFDYRRLRGWAWPIYGGCMLGLLAVLSPLGARANGAQAWISVGPYQVEPAEFAKIGLIVVLAAILAGGRDAPRFRQLLLALAAVGVQTLLVLAQPDFGTAMVSVAIMFGVFLAAGVQARWIVALLLVGSLGVVGMFKLNLVKQYQKERLTAFLNPASDKSGLGATYNLRESLIAIGSGGVHGKGFLKGTQTNLDFVPAQQTDFIFTVVGEEAGFAGGAAVLTLFGVLLWRGLRIAAIARDPFGRLIAVGVVTMLLFQVFVNVGMTVGIMPITGIPLPFVSYGGSSIIATLVGVGLLESIHMRRFT